MSCAHGIVAAAGETAFSIDAGAITFGRGALDEVGARVAALCGAGAKRVALFTDARVGALAPVAIAKASLAREGFDVAVFADVAIEPSDASFMQAASFARDGRFDAYVSVGGGSVIDTCKAALLYATWPADFLAYVNAPVGAGRPVPGPLPPHVACPTTSGTGSELTGIAVCDVLALGVKTGIASRALRPSAAIVDPDATRTLPAAVVAASGFDVLCHALESYTARPFSERPRPARAALRPMSQGRNPWSDLGSLEALRLGGRFLVRAVHDGGDDEAREALMWAATLAGMAFGNAGVHVPHGMAYAVAGLVRDFRLDGYPDAPLVPHGVSVVMSAPAAFQLTAPACPERHLAAAQALGADVRGAAASDAGPIVAATLEALMRAARVPVGLRALGYAEADAPALVRGAAMQRRLLDNAPLPIDEAALARAFALAFDPLARDAEATADDGE
ncbi:MAG: hydroxyacid-oxoacid transhydrogenase [Myxococcota bacterium]